MAMFPLSFLATLSIQSVIQINQKEFNFTPDKIACYVQHCLCSVIFD